MTQVLRRRRSCAAAGPTEGGLLANDKDAGWTRRIIILSFTRILYFRPILTACPPTPFISHTTTCHANLPADGAVMKAWGKDQKIDGTNIRFMGDPAAELTKKLDMELTHPGPASIGIIGRCKRHALIVDDGEVKWFAISEDDDDPAGDDDPEDTCAPAILEALKSL